MLRGSAVVAFGRGSSCPSGGDGGGGCALPARPPAHVTDGETEARRKEGNVGSLLKITR